MAGAPRPRPRPDESVLSDLGSLLRFLGATDEQYAVMDGQLVRVNQGAMWTPVGSLARALPLARNANMFATRRRLGNQELIRALERMARQSPPELRRRGGR